jgi:hypothetical protein
MTVFAMTLNYFKNHALRELTDAMGSKVLSQDVRWVITVPAIWRQRAKQFMREAAYEVKQNSRSCSKTTRNIFQIDFRKLLLLLCKHNF